MQLRNGFERFQAEGFTLIELLTVIAIIAIVSGYVFGVGRSTSESARTARAKAELMALSASLESYRRSYGDYPRTADAADLLQSLIGKRGPTNVAIEGKLLIDLEHFTTFANLDPFTTNTAQAIDPWGQPYHYAYKTLTPWTQASHVLFSGGPDGLHAELLSGGRIDHSAAENRDNVYAR
jgi:general secretion pathway protein G